MTAPTQTQAKPLPDLAAWLVYQHQQDQESLAVSTGLNLGLLWAILQFGKLDESAKPWLHAVTLQVEQSFRASEKLAFDMAQGVRQAWVPGVDVLPLVEAKFPVADVVTGMRVTGPVAVKQRLPAPESEAMASGKLNSSGAGVKFAGEGGRSQVIDFVKRDKPLRKDRRQVIGYARVTDGNPCSFCALLASQGAVFVSGDAFATSNSKIREAKGTARQVRRAFLGDGINKVHDHCKCTMRPVYSLSDMMDARANYFLKQWEDLDKSGLSPKDQVKEFRKFYVPPDAYTAPVVDLSSARANRVALAESLGASAPQVKVYDRAISKVESQADVAKRLLPGLESSLANLRAQGLSDSSPQIEYHLKQITRLSRAS